MSKLKNVTKEDLIEKYESGMLIKEVAKVYEVCEDTVGLWNKRFGINAQEYKKTGIFKKMTKEELVSLYQKGISMTNIAETYGVSQYLIRMKNKEFGLDISDYYEDRVDYNVHVFDCINTESKAYWLGFLYADGNVRSNSNEVALELASIDIPHLIKFKNFMEDTREVSVIKTRNRITPQGNPNQTSCYKVCNPTIKNSLVKYGCIPKKSYVLTFPNMNIFQDPDLVYDFIRGYIDGDGCLSADSTTKRLVISIRGTFDFLSGLRLFFPNEFTRIYSERSKYGTLYKLSCCSDKADKVALKLYGEATIYLDRKYQKFTDLCRNT